LQLLERGSCSGYGSVDIVEQTVLAPRRVGCTLRISVSLICMELYCRL
jgi:hypothetical protein